MEELTVTPHETFVSTGPWNAELPRAMVVCCSDGRLQEATDEFLQRHLGARHYDRFYAPGGPAALVPGGDPSAAHPYRADAGFLIEAHGIEDLILVFHGPAPDGPAAAVCAQYRRLYPAASADQIRDRQTQDIGAVMSFVQGLHQPVRVHAYRAEVLLNGLVQFVPLASPV